MRPAMTWAPSAPTPRRATDANLIRVMLINKEPDTDMTVALDVGELDGSIATSFTFSPADSGRIVEDTVDVSGPVTLPASSITVLELTPTS